MTSVYEELLLKYITGKITEETGSNQPIFNLDSDTLMSNVKNDLLTKLNSLRGATTVNILGKIYSNQFDNFIVYGNYSTSTNTYGYVYVINKQLQEVSLLTTFKSGTLIYPFVSLQQSETGQFYGLTYGTNGTDNDYRVALFNNIISSGVVDNNYSVILRQTYKVPNSANYYSALYRQNRIVKSLDSATYYITVHDENDLTTVIKFTINVGEENTWEVFTIPYLIDTVQFDVLLDKSSGNEIFYLYGIDIITSPNTYRAYKLDEIMTALESISLGNSNIAVFLSQVFAVNKDNIYISAGNNSNHTTYLYKVNNGALTTIYNFTWASSNASYLRLEKVNNIIFCKKKNTGSSSAFISVGILQNGTMYLYDVNTNPNIANLNYDYNDFYIMAQYNLISIFVPNYSTNKTDKLIMDYNVNNYNGTAYESYESLLPTKSRLYNTNGKLVFARNLYNKYINGGTTVSTVEVPNTLLNDEEIITETLLGKTNKYLISNPQNITKNIYETVDINFYNTITMADENSGITIMNDIGAAKINESISAVLDYQNAQATKARVNFEDGTYHIISIDPTTQITITDNYATYTFTIYAPDTNPVKNVEIISYDETTVYATITGVFPGNAFDKITQQVYIL